MGLICSTQLTLDIGGPLQSNLLGLKILVRYNVWSSRDLGAAILAATTASTSLRRKRYDLIKQSTQDESWLYKDLVGFRSCLEMITTKNDLCAVVS